MLDQRGIAERFIAEGDKYSAVGFAGTSLYISDFPTRHNYLLALWQSKFEPILADWVRELGVHVLRGNDVIDFSQDDTGVNVGLSDETSLRSKYLVGCDGGRSSIRKKADIGFSGLNPSISYIRAEAKMDIKPEFGMRPEGGGIGPAPDGGSVGIVIVEKGIDHEGKPSLDELREALISTYGTDYGLRSVSWISRFTDATRQADSYRKGRVLLAGDAAHIHPPQSGQGLNTGIQDAVNLGWKLAQVVKGVSPEGLLDTYHTERHPVGARVLQNTRAQVLLSNPDERHKAVRDIMVELLNMDEPRQHIAAMISGLDIRYDFGERHPLVGRRIPDLDLQTSDGSIRMFSLLQKAEPIFLMLDETDHFDISSWAKHIQAVKAKCVGTLTLPILGKVTVPAAVLIRPDGYVAWAGDSTDPKLYEACEMWFGASTVAH